jgi:Luciferase
MGRILPKRTGPEPSHGPVSAAGHIHHTGVADLAFPREIHDELISDGRAKPHGAGFPGVVSYPIREPEDVPGAVALFRMNYDRAKTAAQRRRTE